MPDATHPSRRRCPQCGKEYGRNAVVCTECGINIDTGERFEASVGEEEVEEVEHDAGPGSVGRQLWVLANEIFPGMTRPGLLLFSVIVSLIGLVLLAAGVFWASVTADVFTGIAVGGIGLVLFAQGLAWVMSGEFYLLAAALTEFDEPRWIAFFVIIAALFAASFKVITHAATLVHSAGDSRTMQPAEP